MPDRTPNSATAASPQSQDKIPPVSPMTRGTVLAFDFGLKRIGVAVGELEVKQANPHSVISTELSDARFEAIAKLLNEWRPVHLVVGLPAHDDADDTPGESREHSMAARCERFANQLRGRFGLGVTLVDERYTSVDAEEQLMQLGKDWRTRKALLDAVAAQLILQDFFDGYNASN